MQNGSTIDYIENGVVKWEALSPLFDN